MYNTNNRRKHAGTTLLPSLRENSTGSSSLTLSSSTSSRIHPQDSHSTMVSDEDDIDLERGLSLPRAPPQSLQPSGYFYHPNLSLIKSDVEALDIDPSEHIGMMYMRHLNSEAMREKIFYIVDRGLATVSRKSTQNMPSFSSTVCSFILILFIHEPRTFVSLFRYTLDIYVLSIQVTVKCKNGV